MAVAYKGFKIAEVNSAGDIVKDYGNIEITIVSYSNSLSSQTVYTSEAMANIIDANTPDRLSIFCFCTLSYNLSMWQGAIPGLIEKPIDALQSGNSLRLIASNGSYIQGASGNLYNAAGQLVGNINQFSVARLTTRTFYFAIPNFDGTVPSTGRIYTETIGQPNSGTLSSNQYSSHLDANIAAWFNDIGPIVEDTDPYAPGGNSEPGGGTGNFDLTSDQIDVPNVPTLSAVDTGLVTLYTPTLAQLQSLARYLWNADATTIDWWKKLVANPLDLVLGLSIVPVAVPQGATENVYVGLINTGIAMTKAASQYVQVDCGSLNVTEFYGAALDYLPFRKTSIYLPFIGTRTISTDDIMGKTVQVVYNIDLLSGALTAMVKCGDAVLYQYSGACNIAIPLSGQSFTDLALSTLQLAAGIGATVATGGTVAGVVAANAANSVMSMKPTIERAGGVSGAAGQLAIMRPYLIGEIPRQSVPEKYNKFAGYPSNISAVLGDLEGYTEVETIYLEGITATSDELNEIETLLKSGVYI